MNHIVSRQHFLLPMQKDGEVSASAKDGFLKHVCVSCQYIYDEAKGFKKRYPPGKKKMIDTHPSWITWLGTRFRDLKTFNCPVCGASKEQFQVVNE